MHLCRCVCVCNIVVMSMSMGVGLCIICVWVWVKTTVLKRVAIVMISLFEKVVFNAQLVNHLLIDLDGAIKP